VLRNLGVINGKMKKLVLLILLVFTAIMNTHARSSQFTKKGVAPLYWMGYEQPYVTDVALTEDRYEKNMKWFASTMLPYGYTMFCTDGWIEGAGSTVNANGYITSYNGSWKHDFAYWMEQAKGMGMDLGVYYNPLWISSDVAGKGCTVAGRSGVRVSSLRGNTDFNGAIWWCDTAKDGAEQYIKGYVRHFINLGFTFLRCDFLRDYENAYGTAKYEQALKWISEEAGDDIIVSLVMPNSYNKNKTENPYGDMFRVSADCFGGGWDFISNRRRGQHNGGWPQWENLFDGFVYFSTISRSTTIMDGDFARLNTCKRPEEKQFWISLLVMAGSPIAIADQYNTIGADSVYYHNRRLLELTKEGFYGKPLSTDLSNKEQSSIWYGKRNTTTYVAAFFNREETPVTYTLPIYSKLNVRTAVDVVDLWTGDTLNNQATNLTFRLNPHECRLVQFTRSYSNQPEPDTRQHLYALGKAWGLWDSQTPWEMKQTADGKYVWEGDLKYYTDNKQFKFCLNTDVWQKTYYLTPTEPICVVDFGREYPMTLCSELTGDLKDYFWGIPEGRDGRFRITADLEKKTVRLDPLVPQIYAIGTCFETDTNYGIAIPRQEGTNVFCYEGIVPRPIDTKCLRFTLGTGDVSKLQCLEPATSGGNVSVADGNAYPMRLCSKSEGTMKNNYWNFRATNYGYKRLLIDVDALTLKVLGVKNLYLNGAPMQQGSSSYLFTLETELHYTVEDLNPLYFTTQWEEGAPLQPIMNRCVGVPAEADGRYLVSFNTRTFEVTFTEIPDAVETLSENASHSSTQIFDLQGRCVTRPEQRGIYIVGGKKVLR